MVKSRKGARSRTRARIRRARTRAKTKATVMTARSLASETEWSAGTCSTAPKGGKAPEGRGKGKKGINSLTDQEWPSEPVAAPPGEIDALFMLEASGEVGAEVLEVAAAAAAAAATAAAAAARDESGPGAAAGGDSIRAPPSADEIPLGPIVPILPCCSQS